MGNALKTHFRDSGMEISERVRSATGIRQARHPFSNIYIVRRISLFPGSRSVSVLSAFSPRCGGFVRAFFDWACFAWYCFRSFAFGLGSIVRLRWLRFVPSLGASRMSVVSFWSFGPLCLALVSRWSVVWFWSFLLHRVGFDPSCSAMVFGRLRLFRSLILCFAPPASRRFHFVLIMIVWRTGGISRLAFVLVVWCGFVFAPLLGASR